MTSEQPTKKLLPQPYAPVAHDREVFLETGTFRSFDGTPVYYEVHGEGPPLVLCYGIVCTMNHWHHQIRYFSQHYRVILFDYRGHHKTPAPFNRDNLSIDGIAQDIRGLCNHLGVEQASFWGHSWGVQVLLRTYDMFPELFHDLVFVNGFATNPFRNMFGATDLVTTLFGGLRNSYEQLPETISFLWKKAVDNPITSRFSAMAGGFNLNLTSLRDVEIYSRGVANVDMDVTIKLFDQMTKYDGRPVLDRIQRPTLIISGTGDRVTPLEFQKTFQTRIKGSELVVVPYGTHCTQLDMPSFVNLAIENFLVRIGFATPQAKRDSLRSKTNETQLE